MKGKYPRYVLTGPPSNGKTSLINHLENSGHLTVQEGARAILSRRKADGDLSGWDFEKEVFSMQEELESLAFKMARERVFFDRSMVDVFAYSKGLFGRIPESFRNFYLKDRYDLVFLPDTLPFQHDGVRIEKSHAEAVKMGEAIREEYDVNGYKIISVPVFSGNKDESIRKRAEFILEKVRKYEARI